MNRDRVGESGFVCSACRKRRDGVKATTLEGLLALNAYCACLEGREKETSGERGKELKGLNGVERVCN